MNGKGMKFECRRSLLDKEEKNCYNTFTRFCIYYKVNEKEKTL